MSARRRTENEGRWTKDRELRTSSHPNRPVSHTMAATWLVAVMANVAVATWPTWPTMVAQLSRRQSLCHSAPPSMAVFFANFSSSVRWLFWRTCAAFWPGSFISRCLSYFVAVCFVLCWLPLRHFSR